MIVTQNNGRLGPFNPKPSHLTLRFKHHTTTITFTCASTKDFKNIQTHLLQALRAAGLSELHGTPLPDSAGDIELARPEDPRDLSKGWVPLGDDGEMNSLMKESESLMDQTPETAGLSNNSVLAFRFKGQEDEGWPVRVASLEDPEEEEEE